MRVFVLTILGLGVSGFAVPSQAMDEFGARFQGKAPIALADKEIAPQDIEPAAGDDEMSKTEFEERLRKALNLVNKQESESGPNDVNETPPAETLDK